ncbi:MAG: glycosyl hydrolase, partial [Actinomycetales bacterium]|nr:glycosyl hydrolase [Actinomycetales bacterium]
AAMFGRGTSGEGSDATDLSLPGVQGELVRAILDTGTPVVLLLITGRPYALGQLAPRARAVVQAFFPGQRGGQALAEILLGDVNPSGRLPVSVPADPGGQPGTYLAPPLARKSGVSSIDPTPLYGFGHGESYTSFEWSQPERVELMPWTTDGVTALELTVTNTGERAGTDVVQLYAHDPVASVVRPDQWLIGYARVELEPGESARVQLEVHADLTSFTGVGGRRIVEPGAIELRVARSSADVHDAVLLWLEGPQREVDHTRVMTTRVTVAREPSVIDVEEVPA